MPWDDLKPRNFVAFDRELNGISRKTMQEN